MRKHPRNGARQPLSGDVWQAINPWSWWLESTGQQVGFTNIYRTEAGDLEQELEILENVASYGNITLSIEPWIPADSVRRAYQDMQKAMLRRKNRPIFELNLAV